MIEYFVGIRKDKDKVTLSEKDGVRSLVFEGYMLLVDTSKMNELLDILKQALIKEEK